MSPDPKTVREIARDALVIAIRRGTTEAVETALIAHGVGGPVVGEKFDAYTNAVAAEYDRLAAERAQPDEQQPADVVTAEQQQDGAATEAAGRVTAFCDALDHYGDDGNPIASEHNPDGDPDTVLYLSLTKQDLRAVLAERTALAARVAELEAVWSVQQDIIEIERRRTEKAEARLAELGEPEVEQRIVGVSGRVYTPTEFDLPHRADWVPGVRLEERQVYPTPWRVAPDAAQDGLSATETDADGSQGSGVELEFGKGAAGLSACCCATKVEGGVRHHCDSDAPHDTHECGDCAHRWDDTTEDGQHG